MSRLTPHRTRRLILLGSTGSIGVNALKVLEHLSSESLASFDVVGIAAGSEATALARQAEKFGVDHAAIADEERADELSGVEHLYTGPDASLQLVEAIAREGDLVVGAVVGSAGVPAILAAIERGCDIALANKETLVAAGGLVLPLVKQKGVNLLPVDSEHNAVAQCLRGGRSIDEVKRLVLTASGGPFRTWPKEKIDRATVEEALNHPTWNMGRKISVDSASMMNKALEVIEAHWLFGLPSEKIDVIVHPQSIMHSFVEFVDGSVLGQLGPPDMKTPIQYALTWPDRLDGSSRKMDWSALKSMEFEPLDNERFPSVDLARKVIEAGGASGAIFNAANEEAVAAFLDQRIAFGRITEIVAEAIQSLPSSPIQELRDVLRADEEARVFVRDLIAGRSGASITPAPAASPTQN